jgi:hypothetical protein
MKRILVFVALVLLAGCATRPPKPAMCRGEFRPVNQDRHAGLPRGTGEWLALCPVQSAGGVYG